MSYQFGMIGLGTMGGNLMLNMNDHGYKVAGYDKNPEQVDIFNALEMDNNSKGFYTLKEMVEVLDSPKTIILLVPAGKIVDLVIEELKPFLKSGDIVIDSGNSHFADTQKRVDDLQTLGIHFMGMGISGGETGARVGPSIMPGGNKVAYGQIAHMLEAISAKAYGLPCTAYMGNGSSGHYVKMVHNGIEYALMQEISEVYHLLKMHGGLDNKELKDVFESWNSGRLKSFLIEVTAAVFDQQDDLGSGSLVDKILDQAAQKGTGAWTSQDASKIGTPVPAIDAAVSQRILSSMKQQRSIASRHYIKNLTIEKAANKFTLINDLENALYAAFILTYAQGLAMLKVASETYNYGINLATVASIWRGGCIIRAELLNKITQAFDEGEGEQNLLLSNTFKSDLDSGMGALRRTVIKGIQNVIPVPALSACLNYHDSYFSEWLPANLIQGQRDFFGAHTYQRNDREGIFHTDWSKTIQ